MTSVTFPTNRGGDGNTYTDDADPITGLDDYGYISRFMLVCSNVLGVANFTVTQADAAAASAVAAAASASSALNAPGTNATSTSSLTVGTGSKSLTLAQTGKAYSVGQTVVVASTASPANQMTGVITAFNAGSGAMTIDAQQSLGSGTFSAWTVSLGALVSSTLPSQTGNNGKALFTNGTSASWADALTPSGNLAGLANKATARANLDLTIGTHVQGFHANLTAVAGLSLVADRLIYANGIGTLALTTFTAFARTLLDDVDGPTARSTLGAQAAHANLTAFSALTGVADRLPYFNGASTMALATFSAFARTLLDDVDAPAARGTLVAAKSGVNNDITELTGLTTALSAALGGTGVTSLAALLAALPITGGFAGELRLGSLHIKWGQVLVTPASSGTTGEGAVAFTTEFPTNFAGAAALPDLTAQVGAIGGTNYAPYVRAPSKSGMNIGLDSSGTPHHTSTVYWLAWGF